MEKNKLFAMRPTRATGFAVLDVGVPALRTTARPHWFLETVKLV
jgi:hypothetical protein